jgi:hypothetical protein
MPKRKAEEHKRLLKRTEKLKQDTADLSTDVTPFNQAQHDKLGADLKQHRTDLAAHRDMVKKHRHGDSE